MEAVVRVYSRVCEWIERLTNAVLVVVLTGLIVVISLQVFSRMFNITLLWTVDIGILLLMWSTFLAAGTGVRHNSHFVIDLWPESWKKLSFVLTLFTGIAVLFLGIVFFTGGLNYVSDIKGATSGMTKLPLSYLISALPVGSILIIIFSVEQMLKAIVEERMGKV